MRPIVNETPEAHVVDFVESTGKESDEKYYEYPGHFTTMAAMKLAKIHQSSPYEPRTDVIT